MTSESVPSGIGHKMIQSRLKGVQKQHKTLSRMIADIIIDVRDEDKDLFQVRFQADIEAVSTE